MRTAMTDMHVRFAIVIVRILRMVLVHFMRPGTEARCSQVNSAFSAGNQHCQHQGDSECLPHRTGTRRGVTNK